ncbi:uncharacterized protein LOC109594698 [Aethina tumida]|uniref:uncharacterized protein LOC109594698 n=1 Tax=Aethina tumida TaxID=116153 RepID=UPI0021494D06|nr:uncharacterized protein LOC109594698 [Aethina tumida]
MSKMSDDIIFKQLKSTLTEAFQIASNLKNIPTELENIKDLDEYDKPSTSGVDPTTLVTRGIIEIVPSHKPYAPKRLRREDVPSPQPRKQQANTQVTRKFVRAGRRIAARPPETE